MMTPVLMVLLWWERKCMMSFLYVGFLYTLKRKLSLVLWMLTSRKGKVLLFSSSYVNCMLLSIEFSFCMSSSMFVRVGHISKVSSMYLA